MKFFLFNPSIHVINSQMIINLKSKKTQGLIVKSSGLSFYFLYSYLIIFL